MEKDIFDYWTTYIILSIVFFLFMVKPYFKDTNTGCSYRDDCVLANILWLISIVSFLYYIGF